MQQINDYIAEAEASGVSLMTIATCEKIASYLRSRPAATLSSGGGFCRSIGARPPMPNIGKIGANNDGFVIMMLPKIPIEVVVVNEATTMIGAIYADGSVTTEGISVATAVSTVTEPTLGDVAVDAYSMPSGETKTPIPTDDQINVNPYARTRQNSLSEIRPSTEPVRRGAIPTRYAPRQAAM